MEKHLENSPPCQKAEASTEIIRPAETNETRPTDGNAVVNFPRKKFFRQRAHCNPLSDTYLVYPPSPDHVDWSVYFPRRFGRLDPLTKLFNTSQCPIDFSCKVDDSLNGRSGPRVRILDVGCGYGGLTINLASLFPETLILGMEIRDKVTEFVGAKINALRQDPNQVHHFDNVAVTRTNVMKFLVNYFRKHQIEKLFFCFPDPHFKQSKFRRRIIGPAMLTLYAYVLKPGGTIYTVTDVPALHDWIASSLRSHPLFEEIPITDQLRASDFCVDIMETQTEEGKKVIREGRPRFSSVFRRLDEKRILTKPSN